MQNLIKFWLNHLHVINHILFVVLFLLGIWAMVYVEPWYIVASVFALILTRV